MTEEGWRVVEEGQALQQTGHHGGDPTWNCIPPGMPRVIVGVLLTEFIVRPNTTLIFQEYMMQVRRIYTDGRTWPEYIEPSFNGYSIGHWEDSDEDGVFDVLNIETRAIGGKRSYGAIGLPLSNDTIVHERIFLDPEDPNIIRNQVTTVDGYLTEPWAVVRSLHRDREPVWYDFTCQDDNRHIMVNDEFYTLNWDRTVVMPTRENQPPPPYYQVDAE